MHALMLEGAGAACQGGWPGAWSVVPVAAHAVDAERDVWGLSDLWQMLLPCGHSWTAHLLGGLAGWRWCFAVGGVQPPEHLGHLEAGKQSPVRMQGLSWFWCCKRISIYALADARADAWEPRLHMVNVANTYWQSYASTDTDTQNPRMKWKRIRGWEGVHILSVPSQREDS